MTGGVQTLKTNPVQMRARWVQLLYPAQGHAAGPPDRAHRHQALVLRHLRQGAQAQVSSKLQTGRNARLELHLI